MKADKNTLKLYAVTDRKWLNGGSLAEQVEKAARAGVTMVQLREKEIGFDEYVALAIEIAAVAHRYDIPLIINDNVEVAIASGADGVHVGQSDMEAANARRKIGPDRILGVSAETVESALEAERCGADYIGTGALFTTSTKEDAQNISLSELKEICDSVSIPVVAIGGITEKNIMDLSGSGIVGVALVSAIFAQKDIKASVSRLLTLIEKIVKSEKGVTR